MATESSITIKMRVKVSYLEAIDAAAAAASMNRSQYIIKAALNSPVQGSRPSPEPIKASTRDLNAAIPSLRPASSLPNPPDQRYQRPKHTENCHCYACQPPK